MPASAHLGDDLEEALDLVVGEHGRGLVEHEHAAALPALQRGGDRDDGPLRPGSPRPAGGGCRGRRRTPRAPGGSRPPAGATAPGRRSRGRSRRAARGCPGRSARGSGRGPGGRSAGRRARTWPTSKGTPSISAYAPGSAEWYAASSLISVDLPEPFCPMRAWTSPGAMSSETSSRALVPGNVLDRCSIRSTGREVGSAALEPVWRSSCGTFTRGLPSVVRGSELSSLQLENRHGVDVMATTQRKIIEAN